jgi:cell division protein FtsQ
MSSPRSAKVNRRLPQRRPWRSRLPDRTTVAAAVARGLRRAAWPLAGIAMCGALAGGIWLGMRWLGSSPRFAVSEIDVVGADASRVDDVRRRAGIALGTNVFAVDLLAAERALRGSPWIAEVDVRRALPDRIVVEIRERTPVALLLVEGKLYLADAQGVPFKRAAGSDGAGLTVITGLPALLFRDDRGPALVRRALGTAAAWKNAERPEVGEIHLEASGLTLYLAPGAIAVRLGRQDAVGEQAAMRRFDAAWAALSPAERAGVKTLHLDSRTRPDRVVIAMKRDE